MSSNISSNNPNINGSNFLSGVEAPGQVAVPSETAAPPETIPTAVLPMEPTPNIEHPNSDTILSGTMERGSDTLKSAAEEPSSGNLSIAADTEVRGVRQRSSSSATGSMSNLKTVESRALRTSTIRPRSASITPTPPRGGSPPRLSSAPNAIMPMDVSVQIQQQMKERSVQLQKQFKETTGDKNEIKKDIVKLACEFDNNGNPDEAVNLLSETLLSDPKGIHDTVSLILDTHSKTSLVDKLLNHESTKGKIDVLALAKELAANGKESLAAKILVNNCNPGDPKSLANIKNLMKEHLNSKFGMEFTKLLMIKTTNIQKTEPAAPSVAPSQAKFEGALKRLSPNVRDLQKLHAEGKKDTPKYQEIRQTITEQYDAFIKDPGFLEYAQANGSFALQLSDLTNQLHDLKDSTFSFKKTLKDDLTGIFKGQLNSIEKQLDASWDSLLELSTKLGSMNQEIAAGTKDVREKKALMDKEGTQSLKAKDKLVDAWKTLISICSTVKKPGADSKLTWSISPKYNPNAESEQSKNTRILVMEGFETRYAQNIEDGIRHIDVTRKSAEKLRAAPSKDGLLQFIADNSKLTDIAKSIPRDATAMRMELQDIQNEKHPRYKEREVATTVNGKLIAAHAKNVDQINAATKDPSLSQLSTLVSKAGEHLRACKLAVEREKPDPQQLKQSLDNLNKEVASLEGKMNPGDPIVGMLKAEISQYQTVLGRLEIQEIQEKAGEHLKACKQAVEQQKPNIDLLKSSLDNLTREVASLESKTNPGDPIVGKFKSEISHYQTILGKLQEQEPPVTPLKPPSA